MYGRYGIICSYSHNNIEYVLFVAMLAPASFKIIFSVSLLETTYFRSEEVNLKADHNTIEIKEQLTYISKKYICLFTAMLKIIFFTCVL